LHAHTTASDGRSTPAELIRRAVEVGITTLGVTDHDTIAALDEAAREAHAAGIGFVPGIEITSVCKGKDAHVLAYFLDALTPELTTLMVDQRRRRAERAREIGARLARMGAPIDVDALLAANGERSGKAIARPQIAQALIRAGHVKDVPEAFERFLGESCGAYVPHTGASPEEVVALIVAAGGIASLAHPGHLNKDDAIPAMIDAGMAAIEAYHSSHDEAATAHYVAMARQQRLAITGGSDYHGEGVRRAEFFGVTRLPEAEFQRFLERAGVMANGKW
jgi:predicted metal-dependent phosphoesterase TrpH